MSLFSGSDLGDLGDLGDLSDDSGGPADPGTRLSSMELSDDDSSDSLFVREDEIKPEETHHGSGGRSNEEDTDSLDESGTGSDMDTDDEGEGHANEHHVGTAGFEPPQRLYGSTEKALENG